MTSAHKTDWDLYYEKPYRAARYTRAITKKILVSLIRGYAPNLGNLRIAELGGANSCFFDSMVREFKPQSYLVIDKNEAGLRKFAEKTGSMPNVRALDRDVLNLDLDEKFDVVYSVGLIEHFPLESIEKAIRAHFDLLAPEGIVIITFPTPTILYKMTRRVSELMGMWIFHDERPIRMDEAQKRIKKFGNIFYMKINWPIMLTQGIIAARKGAA